MFAEILRVSGMIPKHGGFGDFDRLQRGSPSPSPSPSPLCSSEMMPNIVRGTSLGGWNGLPQEVCAHMLVSVNFAPPLV